ncbi:acyl coA binding protein [Ditylenchus destructor]|nr:acyl coA binding protein [Ditylenchus destructor]
MSFYCRFGAFFFLAMVLAMCLGPAECVTFEEAVEQVTNLKKSPNGDEQLQLYGLYNQAVIGDVNTTRPGMMDIRNRAKWDAWNRLKGTSKADAKKRYITLAGQMVKKYGS